MSATISSGGFPVLAQLLYGMRQIRQRFDALTQQASSGLIAATYAGLDGSAPVALALSPKIDNLRVLQNNIDSAGGPAQVAQTAMKQIQAITASLLAQLPKLNGLDPAQIDIIAGTARDDLAHVAALLDSQYGGVYVFAGVDSLNPPVPDPNQIETSGFFLQISAAVVNMAGPGAVATAALTLTIAGSNTAGTSPFSTYMSQSPNNLLLPSASTGEGQSLTLGLFASANTGLASIGASTTGSYMRDLMRALATIGSLSSSQASDPNFALLVADTQTSILDATTAMSTDVGILGEKQSALIARKTILSDTSIVLSGQLSSARDVDMALTLSNLTLTQTQLQASYQLISTANSMSLVKFLSAG